MKNFLKLLLIVVIMFFVSCSKPPTKVRGIVAKFEAEGSATERIGKGPKIEFADGRIFLLSIIPNRSVDVGSEVEIFYTGRSGRMLGLDSVVIIKPAPLVASQITKEDLFPGKENTALDDKKIIRYKGSKDFETLVKLVITKGTKITASDYEYIHRDASVNRHALTAIRRTNNRADPTAPVSQIFVFVKHRFYHGDILYGYNIKPEGIEYDNPGDTLAIRSVIKDLLVVARE